MEWWSEMQADRPLKNQLGIPAETLKRLAEDMNRYGSVNPDLPAPLMRFIVDGEEESVLSTLNQAGILAYDLNAYNTKLFKSIPIPDPTIFWRIMRVFCAEKNYLNSYQATASISSIMLVRIFLGLWNKLEVKKQPTAQFIEDILINSGEKPGSLVELIFGINPHKNWQDQELAASGKKLRDWDPLTQKYSSRILEILNQATTDQKIHILDFFKETKISLDPFHDSILDLALASQKTVREAALPLIKTHPKVFLEGLTHKVKNGKTDERYNAVPLLTDLYNDVGKSILQSCLESEKVAKVRSAIEQALAIPASIQPIDPESDPLSLPPLPEIDPSPAIAESIQSELQVLIELRNKAAEQEGERLTEKVIQARKNPASWGYLRWSLPHLQEKDSNQLQKMLADPAFSNDHIRQFLQAKFKQLTDPLGVSDILERLNSKLTPPNTKAFNSLAEKIYFGNFQVYEKQLYEILEHPDIQPIHLIKLLEVFPNHHSNWVDAPYLAHAYRIHPQWGGWRELASVLATAGKGTEGFDDLLTRSYGVDHTYSLWDPSQIWPYFVDRIPQIEKALESSNQKSLAMRLLKLFPTIPPVLVPSLWKIALGSAARDRVQAQGCLDKLPETRQRVIGLLTDSRAEQRAIAAEWIGNALISSANEPLRQAIQKESNDTTKDLMLRSLEKLGASVEEFLNRETLLEEAKKGLKKGIPAAIQWIPFAAMPEVTWADSGEPVDPEILQWLIVQAFKQKTPTPGPILRRYVSQFHLEHRGHFGQFVLSSWLAQDTLPKHTLQQADQLAQQLAQQQFAYVQQQIQHYQNWLQSPQMNTWVTQNMSAQQQQEWLNQQIQSMQQSLQIQQAITFEQLYRKYYNDALQTCAGSATSEKGILAIAAACCGFAAIPPISHYLKTWYGTRLAQCKSLLEVLSWIDDPSAIQLLLSVANRFRTKAIQKDAETRVTEIAERQGWTLDELADRTIPTAGLNESGVLILEYGERHFEARLEPQGLLTLTDPVNGKPLKSLPNPRKDDDEELAKAAKQLFSDCKKQIKQVLSLQQERLYEAMCTQRTWHFADWDRFLRQHPIVGHYCQRLIWAVVDAEHKVTCLFRPLEDGSLTDADDQEIQLKATDRIHLAHACNVSSDQAQAWRQHFADYEVDPLLDQFPNQVYRFQEDESATSLTDFEGYLLESFQLRGLLTKRGYTRGQAEDGGSFFTYHKRFLGLGLEAVIEFSGSYVPEENLTVALVSLSFSALPPDSAPKYGARIPMSFSQIPPVLLSEVWNDLRLAAAQGKGFNPNWRQLVW